MKNQIITFKLSLLIIAFCLILVKASGQPFETVRIKGKLKMPIEAGTKFRARIVQNYANPCWMSYTHSYEVPLDSAGNFELSFEPDQRIFYCMFYFQNAAQDMIDFADLSDARTWLLAAGDDLLMDIDKDDIKFSGRGSEKLTCQYLVDKSPVYVSSSFTAMDRLVDRKRYKEALDLHVNSIERNLVRNLDIIDAFRTEINNDSIYRILKFDCIGRSYTGLAKVFQRYRFRDYKFDLFKNKLHSGMYQIDTLSDDLAAFSWNYTNYLFERAYTRSHYLNAEKEANKSFDYREMLDHILARAPGRLRDVLLVNSVLNLAGEKSEIYDLIPKIKRNLSTKEGRSLFAHWEDKNANKKAAYPFELPDTLDKMHRLADFKGKILIMDFWFNGCFGCIVLNKEIESVVKRYEHNPKVKFISVNVDIARKAWLEGLKSGKYSYPGHLNLSTFGTSPYDNEMFKFYNYTSLPRLLVIDQRGRIVMSNAPDPRQDKGKKLIELIDSML